MSNGDAYLFEPYSTQQNLTINNFAFRDYFQGAIKTNDVYLGNVIIPKTASSFRSGGIAIPVYSSSENNSSKLEYGLVVLILKFLIRNFNR
jgi:hypothetical protein